VNIDGAPFQAPIGESEALCSPFFAHSNGRPEPELQVRFETCGGQCPCSGSTCMRSLRPKNGAPGDASAQEHCQGSDGAEAGSSLVLDVAEWM